MPVEQDDIPRWHGFGGVHIMFEMQGLHVPLLQTAGDAMVPQLIPFWTLATSTQTAEPVAQEYIPVRHRLVGVQVPPAVQAVQRPALQTLFVPQVLPLDRFFPVSEQVIAGEQLIAPAWQGFAAGVQVMFRVHGEQVPSAQTMLAPQVVPLAALADSVQTGAPVSQVMVPVRQGLPLIGQVIPAWQATQVPAPSHTLFVPQPVPAAAGVVLSLQTAIPLSQASAPWWQAFAGTQDAPVWQFVHCPLRQTMPLPHDMPFG